MLRQFIREESGATAVEYGLIVAVLSLAIVSGLSQYADKLNFLFGNNSSELQKALK